METGDHEVKPPHVVTYRSPSFRREEIKVLLQLIEKYKVVILNKSTTAAVSHAKEIAWIKIAKIFNSQGFPHKRGAECLKTKWENLKRNAKKVSKNVINAKYDDFIDLTGQVVALMCEAEISPNMIDVPQEIEEELKEALQDDKEDNSDVTPNCNDNKQQSEDSDDENAVRINRSLNFSPQESSILLKCVKEEKKLIFSKVNTGKAIQLKNRAWSRITEAFNKRSPQKRSTRVLRTKFNNMKRNAKNGYFDRYIKGKRHEKLTEEDSKVLQEIKAEPNFEYKVNDSDDPDASSDDNGADNGINDAVPDSATNHFPDAAPDPDPLSTVLSTDSGLGSTSFMGAYNFGNNEVTKLKLELLNYQIETAKLERQRTQEALKAETAARESLAIERSLKLRTARLETIAAELKLPAAHPGLQFHFEEARAQRYMDQYRT